MSAALACRDGCGACCIAPSISSPIPDMPAGKPAGVIGITIGTLGTAIAQQHLRAVLTQLDAPVLCQPEGYCIFKEGFFGADGALAEGDRKFLQRWMDAFAAWVRRLNA